MKVCTGCGEEKDLDSFYVKHIEEDGSQYFNPRCKTCYTAASRKRYRDNPGKHGRLNRLAYLRLKRNLFDAYGAFCRCCGENTYDLLSVDHINGRDDSESLKGPALYRYLRDQGYPKDNYQVLCYGCNQGKGLHGVCPHQSINVFEAAGV